MNYHQYYPVDIINGSGTRCTLFVSGCEHQCPGCYNKSTWRLNSGLPFTAQMEDRIICHLQDTRIRRQGLSLSGGDPLHPANLAPVRRMLQRVRRECPGKDAWMWTGYTLGALIWRGGSNQVIHDLNALRTAQGATLQTSPNAADITETMGAAEAGAVTKPRVAAEAGGGSPGGAGGANGPLPASVASVRCGALGRHIDDEHGYARAQALFIGPRGELSISANLLPQGGLSR